MKRFQLLMLLFFFLIFGNLFLISQEVKDNKNEIELYHSYEPYKIFDNLYYLVNKNKQVDKRVFETIDYIKNKIDKKELLLLVDHKNDSTDILSGAFFYASKDKQKVKPYILLNKNVIDVFYYQESIVFSMLMHEIQHAYDYYTNYGLFEVSDENILEGYMFQMDALYLEVLLIEKFLVPNDYKITDFEKKLLESHQKNNLAEFSQIFETTDMKLIYKLYHLMNNKDSYENNFKEIINTGNALIDDFNKIDNFKEVKDEKDEWLKYQILVSLYSFTKYINQVAYTIINSKYKNMSPNEFNLNDYSPELFKQLNTIKDLLLPYAEIIDNYKSRNIKMVKNIYEKYLEEITKHEYLIFDQNFIYLHIIPSDMLKIKESIKPNEYLGEIEKKPDVLSEKYNFIINKSIKLYNGKNYEQAAKSLETALKNDPENPFILNYYAKALYWFDNDNSYKYYKKLIDILDKQQIGEKYLELKNSKNNLLEIKNEKLKKEIEEISYEIAKINKDKIKIDYWFTEAYWKLGTLYLDRSDYLRGIYEITRSMVTTDNYDLIKEQAYSYLCESFCFLNKPELANYCADQVFIINPENKYVLKYLDMLKENIK